MKIGFDAKRFFENRSGLGSYSRTLIQGFLDHYPDIKLHLFAPRAEAPQPDKRTLLSGKVEVYKGFQIAWVWRVFLIPFLLYKQKVAVYHGLSGELPLFLFGREIRKVVTVHDVIFRSRPQDYKIWDRWIYDLKTRWALRKADQIICISEYTKNQVLKYYHPDPDKIQIVHPSVNPIHRVSGSHLKGSEFKSLYNVKAPYLLFVGNVRGRKNIEILISAVSLLPKSRRKKLIIITNDKYRWILERYKNDDILDWIRIETDISDRVLADYYRYASAVICPSLEEGFGLPVAEAISHGVVTLCSEIGAHKESGGDQAYFFPPNDATALAGLLSNLSYRERKIRKEALSHLKKFDLKRNTDQLMDVYRIS